MSLVLAIETTTDVCAVAVASDGALLAELTLDRPRRHAEQLVPMVDDVLRIAGCGRSDVRVVGISAGPGSYTGLRIGAATAKGLAFALGAALVPVPSLQALAGSVPGQAGTIVIPAFAARRDEIFAAVFRLNGTSLPDELLGPVAGDPESILNGALDQGIGRMDGRTLVVVGDGGPRVTVAARHLGLPTVHHPWIRPAAGAVARAATLLAGAGGSVDVESFEPYYLREFTARPAARSIFERLPF